MTTLQRFLNDRINQLSCRHNTVSAVLRRPEAFLGGKKAYTEEDLKKIDAEILECEAALKSVIEHNKKTQP